MLFTLMNMEIGVLKTMIGVVLKILPQPSPLPRLLMMIVGLLYWVTHVVKLTILLLTLMNTEVGVLKITIGAVLKTLPLLPLLVGLLL